MASISPVFLGSSHNSRTQLQRLSQTRLTNARDCSTSLGSLAKFTAIAAPYRVRFVIAEPNALPKKRLEGDRACAMLSLSGWWLD
jgi:hypothetical protein